MNLSEENAEVTGSGTAMQSSQMPVRPSLVPEYLRESEFFKSLDLEDDGEFRIPVNVMKADTRVDTVQDIWDLLNTVRFWGLDVSRVSSLQNVESIYEKVVREGSVACLQLLDQVPKLRIGEGGYMHRGLDWSDELTSVAAECGQLECLKFLHEKGCSVQNCFVPAAANNQLECLQFALEKAELDVDSFVNACAAAEGGSHAACLSLLTEGNKDNKKLGVDAAAQGSLDGLKCYRKYGGKWHFFIGHAAALNGHLHCLMYAHDHGCPLMPETHHSGHNCEYRNAFGHQQDGPKALVGKVTQRGHWECVRYLILENCPLTADFDEALEYRNKHCIECARIGSVRGLAEAMDRTFILIPEIMVAAVRGGSVNCLRYAHEHGCPWSREACTVAAIYNQLECLKYAHENGCPWDCRVVLLAKKRGYRDILNYALANGCPEEWRQGEEKWVKENRYDWVTELKQTSKFLDF